LKPPAKVQVGPYLYSVVVDEAAINKASVESQSWRIGDSNHGKLIITLDPSMAPDMMASVLLHEIEHACLAQVGADEDLTKEQLERVCNATSTMLLDTLRRNPKLVEFLIGER
jgi:hypothetical protein